MSPVALTLIVHGVADMILLRTVEVKSFLVLTGDEVALERRWGKKVKAQRTYELLGSLSSGKVMSPEVHYR